LALDVPGVIGVGLDPGAWNGSLPTGCDVVDCIVQPSPGGNGIPFPLYIGIPLDIDVDPQFPEAQPPPIMAALPSYVMGGLNCPEWTPKSGQHELQQSPQQPSSPASYRPLRPDLSVRQRLCRERFRGCSLSQPSSQSAQRE
jgi:hypothetical protein